MAINYAAFEVRIHGMALASWEDLRVLQERIKALLSERLEYAQDPDRGGLGGASRSTCSSPPAISSGCHRFCHKLSH